MGFTWRFGRRINGIKHGIKMDINEIDSVGLKGINGIVKVGK